MSDNSTATSSDLVYSQKSRSTQGYGKSGVTAPHVSSGQFIHTLEVYMVNVDDNANDTSICGMLIAFANTSGQTNGVTLGQVSGSSKIYIPLYNDAITLLKLLEGDNGAVKGIYFETLKGTAIRPRRLRVRIARITGSRSCLRAATRLRP